MVEITGHYTTIRGARTFFETAGEGHPVLLLHAAGSQTRQWHSFMERAQGPFRFVAADMPGHGKSWPMDGHKLLSDVNEMASWIKEFAEDRFGLQRFSVMGVSIGANLSLLLAATYPDLVQAAVSLQGADHTPSVNEAALEAGSLHPQINPLHGSIEFFRSLLGSRATAEGTERMMWNSKTGDSITRYTDLGAYTRCDIRAQMANIKCPVLLVHASDDWIVPRERVDATASRIANAQVVSLDGLGHSPALEDPVRTAEIVLPFLSRHLAKAAA
jgi:pimeloyl-ACP methyl ester carboxylesterase